MGESDAGMWMAQEIFCVFHLCSTEDFPRRKIFRELHDDYLAADIGRVGGPFVAMQDIGTEDDKVKFIKVLCRITYNAFALDIKGEVELEVLMKMKREVTNSI